MKYLILMISLFFHNFGKSYGQINQIEIRQSDFGMTSIFKIDCDKFEEYFAQEIDTVVIYNLLTIKEFTEILCNLEPDSSKTTPDTRAKLLFYEDDKIKHVLCMSEIRIMIDGKLYLRNKRLVKLVEEVFMELDKD